MGELSSNDVPFNEMAWERRQETGMDKRNRFRMLHRLDDDFQLIGALKCTHWEDWQREILQKLLDEWVSPNQELLDRYPALE